MENAVDEETVPLSCRRPEHPEYAGLFDQTGKHIEDDGIDWPHDQVFDCAGREKHQESLSVKHIQPERVQDDVDYQNNDQLCKQDPPESELLFVIEAAVDKSGQHGIKGETEEKGSVRFQKIFDNIEDPRKQTSGDRSEQIVDQLIGNR